MTLNAATWSAALERARLAARQQLQGTYYGQRLTIVGKSAHPRNSNVEFARLGSVKKFSRQLTANFYVQQRVSRLVEHHFMIVEPVVDMMSSLVMSGAPPSKAVVSAGNFPRYVDPLQPPSKKKPFSAMMSQDFTHTVDGQPPRSCVCRY